MTNNIIIFYSTGYVPAENGTFDSLLNLGGMYNAFSVSFLPQKLAHTDQFLLFKL